MFLTPITELKESFSLIFKDKIFFVYLNKKQDSRAAIASYQDNKCNIAGSVAKINTISNSVITAKTTKEFAIALENHELEMSSILEVTTVCNRAFPYSGSSNQPNR